MKPPLPTGPWQVHTWPAMNTLFTLRLGTGDAAGAAAFAGQCFRQLDELESLLSRYREDSEISAINRLETGGSLLLHEETWSCLGLALEAQALTGGLFDTTLGSLTGEDRTARESGLRGCLSLSPDRPEIFCVEAGRHLDLGAIGKGYAIDRMADTLRELGLTEALLSAGASTHLAIGSSPWPVDLATGTAPCPIVLRESSLSASGTAIQGNHIVHPDRDTGAEGFPCRVWAVAKTAALSDAFSTACFLADEEEREGFLRTVPELSGILVQNPDGKMVVTKGSLLDLPE